MMSTALSHKIKAFLRAAVSYLLLTLGACFMLFPVIWMVSASLKPDWQIFTTPIIWFPQAWINTPAGETTALINLWQAPNEDGVIEDVVRLGRQRYTPIVAVETITQVMLIPREAAGRATSTPVDGINLNVRQWQGEPVVALGTYGDDLIVVNVDALQEIEIISLFEFNQGQRGRHTFIIDDVSATVEVRTLVGEDEGTRDYIALGPQFETITVVSADATEHMRLVFSTDLESIGTQPVGETFIEVFTVGDEEYILIEQAEWRPVISINALREHAFTVPLSTLSIDSEPSVFGVSVLRTGLYQPQEQEAEPQPVVILASSQNLGTALVMEPAHVEEHVQLIQSSQLAETLVENVNGFSLRVRDFNRITSDDPLVDISRTGPIVGLVGETQRMSLVVPVEAAASARDVMINETSLKTRPSLRIANYQLALTREISGVNFIRFFMNSAMVAGLSIAGHLFSCTLAAYGFARLRSPGKRILFFIVIATLLLPFPVTLVPVYEIFVNLGMVNTLWPLFIRSFFGNAFFIFLLRQFFSTIPVELEEAARIDGANRMQTLVYVLLPLMKPALATVTIFTFLASWNDLFNALIYLQTPPNFTVAIGLSAFSGVYSAEFNLLMAAAVIVMLPTIILFFFTQRFFIEGITLTGLKG
ncbi:MAG: ABC transporter permease subunit [Aggregatilineales bacterium]